jgi:hypothetical protein
VVKQQALYIEANKVFSLSGKLCKEYNDKKRVDPGESIVDVEIT